MATHDDDPAMAQAIARSEEARAQILRGKATSNPAYKAQADEAERRARKASRRVSGLPDEVHPDPEGTGKPATEPAKAGTNAPAVGPDLSGQHKAGEPSREDVLAARSQIVIPDQWTELTWPERKSLASKISDTPVGNGEEANKAINAELARRGEK